MANEVCGGRIAREDKEECDRSHAPTAAARIGPEIPSILTNADRALPS